MNPNLIWISWLVLFGILETIGLVTKRREDTLSERTRAWFKTATPAGRIIFGVTWAAFSLWYFLHILFQ